MVETLAKKLSPRFHVKHSYSTTLTNRCKSRYFNDLRKIGCGVSARNSGARGWISGSSIGRVDFGSVCREGGFEVGKGGVFEQESASMRLSLNLNLSTMLTGGKDLPLPPGSGAGGGSRTRRRRLNPSRINVSH